MAFNSLARRLALLGIVGGVIVGYFNCSLNGSIEMDGFKSTFSELYSSDQLSGSPDNSTSLDGQVCSSGNGADSDMLIGFITSSGNIMAVVGGLSAGWLADHLSRKYTFLIVGLSAMIGGALSAVSFHALTLIIGRGFGGISMGYIILLYKLGYEGHAIKPS